MTEELHKKLEEIHEESKGIRMRMEQHFNDHEYQTKRIHESVFVMRTHIIQLIEIMRRWIGPKK